MHFNLIQINLIILKDRDLVIPLQSKVPVDFRP